MGMGKLLSGVVKVVTVPLDMLDAGADILTGGNGKKHGREQIKDAIPTPSSARDALCDILEDLDK